MRKLILCLLGFLIFCLFAIFGYLSASHGQNTQPPGYVVNEAIPTPFQENILLIQTDQFVSPSPRLISVWAAYYFKSTHQTVLTFSEIYPSTDPSIDSDGIVKGFSLNRDGSPIESFFQKIKARGGPWINYVMIDGEGSLKIQEWLQESGFPVEATTPFDAAPMMDAICQSISSNHPQSTAKFLLDWEAVAPNLKTNIDKKKVVDTWGDITYPERPAHCRILKDPPH